MKHILTLFLIICCQILAVAQTVDEQVLIYRNTGITDLLYTSELDSIVLSCKDAKGTTYDEPVSQVFYAQDTTLVVPIAEIDSVAFGNHNVIEFYEDVKQFSAEKDGSWIVRVGSNSIIYKTNTPKNLLPLMGQKIFYGTPDDMLPYGICGKVVAINNPSEGIEFIIESVELKDIFKRFFYAGTIGDENTLGSKGRALDFNGSISKKYDLPVGNFGKFSVEFNGKLKGKAVIDPFKDYVNARLTLSFTEKMGAYFKAEAKTKENMVIKPTPGIHLPIASVGGILNVTVDLLAFLDAQASLKFDYEMERSFTFGIDWTHKSGNETVKPIEPKPSTENNKNTAKAEVRLDGSLFFGPQVNIDLNAINLAAIRVKTKIGPKISGELSTKVISDLSKEYDYKLYKKGELDFCGRIEIAPFLVYHENILFGEEKEKSLFDISYSKEFGKQTFNMFPPMPEAKAVRTVTNPQNNCLSRTDPDYVPSNTPDGGSTGGSTTPTPTRFEQQMELLAKVKRETKSIQQKVDYYTEYGYWPEVEGERSDTAKVIKSLNSKTVSVNDSTDIMVMEDRQQIQDSTSMEKKIIMHPVAKYMDTYLQGPSVIAAQGSCLLPVTGIMSNGAATVVMGSSIIGAACNDSVQAHVGNYLPIYIRDKVAVPEPMSFKPSASCSVAILISNWIDNVTDQHLILSLSSDGKGALYVKEKCYPFSYSADYPRTGQLTLYYTDGTSEVLTVESLTENELVVVFNKTKQIYVLNKQ